MTTPVLERAPFREAGSSRSDPDGPAVGASTTVLVLLIVQCALAIAMYLNAPLASLHALIVLGGGFLLALLGRRIELLVLTTAYIVGAEVLWRMTQARIPWETAKYAVIGLLGLSLVRYLSRWRRPTLPVVLILMLLPGVWLTVSRLGFGDAARDAVSFNLTGMSALVVAYLFFSQLDVSRDEMRLVLWSLVIPIAGIATIALYSTVTAEALQFTQESNFVTSAGFGPNQVSTGLGLGAMLCLFLTVLERSPAMRFVCLILAGWMIGEAALTFSRGGLYSAGVAAAVGLAHLLRGRGGRTIVITAALSLSVVAYLLLPMLNEFTGGELTERFGTFEASGRDRIIAADLGLWRENPLFGVGVGLARYERTSITEAELAAHTEFTRLVAEHGVPGLLAIIILVFMAVAAYRRAPTALARGLTSGFVIWALSEMVHSAMRLASISFIFGLAAVGWTLRRSAGSEPEP